MVQQQAAVTIPKRTNYPRPSVGKYRDPEATGKIQKGVQVVSGFADNFGIS
jgi:hypothetical protein